jgi:hypothetical protein
LEREKADGRDEHGTGRPGPPLGRGLEDVSHFFLSGTPPARSARHAPDEPANRAGDEAPRLLHGAAALDRPQLVAFLEHHLDALEPGLRALDTGLPCDGCGEIDLLAVDSAHRLAIVDVETGADDRLLLRGLAHFDWVVRNVAILRRLYQASVTDFSLRPKIFLVAPGVSSTARCAARQISAPRIGWCSYRPLAIGGGVGIVLDSDPAVA